MTSDRVQKDDGPELIGPEHVGPDHERRHASAISWRGMGVLLLGESGAGKSLLARYMVDRGWGFIGDDQVHIKRQPSGLYLIGDARLKGLIEIRNYGIIRVSTAPPARLCLAAHICESPSGNKPDSTDRIPGEKYLHILGEPVPLITLSAHDIGVGSMLEMALTGKRLDS